jgi:hypothetical protein
MHRMLRVRLIVVSSILAAVGVGLGAMPATGAEPDRGADHAVVAPSGVDDFSFASLDVEYTLTRAENGTSRMRVVETFVAVFPETDQNHGMRRSIPNSYLGSPLFPARPPDIRLHV